MAERVRGDWDESSSEENSAPDWDMLTYIEPSLYACPEGDRLNPHREGAEVGKQFLEGLGWNVKAQTSLDMDKPLSVDPQLEAAECYTDRDTLTTQLQVCVCARARARVLACVRAQDSLSLCLSPRVCT